MLLRSKTLSHTLIIGVAFIFLLSSGQVGAYGQKKDKKITAEEVVANHSRSVGSAEARQAIKSMTGVGSVTATFKGRGEGRAEGIVVFGSQGEMNMIGMKFNNPDYPYERLAYDGSKFDVGFVRPGEYTVLGQFLRINERTFKNGIMGGILSTSWDLSRLGEDGVKLRARGTTKIDGNETLKFSYAPPKGSDLDVMLFFDAETFRHVRTEYTRRIAAAQGLTVDTSARQSETRYKMVEDFSDFRSANDLTLPHGYKLYLEILTGNGTTSYTWVANIQQFTMNTELADMEFKIN